MGKIKINLVSGASIEKPLVSCFKGTNANYVVLDNESNGSMGLPIIIISKLNGTNLEKIIDPNEWGAVKENLKTIIGGTALPYLTVPETLNAPDDFFTQLTLPVASYDLLKSVYAPPVAETPAPVEAPAAPVETAPAETAPVAEAPAEPAVATPTEITLAPIPEVAAPEAAPIAAETPVAPATTPEVTVTPTATPEAAAPAAPVVETPAVAEPAMPVNTPAPVEAATIEAPVTAETPVAPAPETPAVPVDTPVASPEAPVAPIVEEAPTMAPVADQVPTAPETPASAEASAPAIDLPVSQPATVTGDPDINLIKETFMKSCENMFDALMKKFENKN